MEMTLVVKTRCSVFQATLWAVATFFSSGPPVAASEPSPAPDAALIEQWSQKFLGWHYYPQYVIGPTPGIPGVAAIQMTDCPTVFQLPDDAHWYMTFIGFDGQGYQSFLATSEDLVHWRQLGLALGYGPPGEFDHGGRVLGAYLYQTYDLDGARTLKRRDGKFWSLYGAYPRQGGYELRPGYEGLACSDDGKIWQRAQVQPILSVYDRDCGTWEKDCIYQPWVVEHEGKFWDFYNAAHGSVEQLGLAESSDLFHWQRHEGNPVIRNRPGGFDAQFCSDGKVFWDHDHWVMFYFGVGRGGAHIMAAFSRDLVYWSARYEPLYRAGGHPGGLDKTYTHKISIAFNPKNATYYMFYTAVGPQGRGIALLTSKPIGTDSK